MRFRPKSIVGMFIGLFLGLVACFVYVSYGDGVDKALEIISYISIIILALFILLLVIGFYFEDKDNGKKGATIKLAIYTILIIAISSVILIIPEIRLRVFLLLKIFFFIGIIILVPSYINNLMRK